MLKDLFPFTAWDFPLQELLSEVNGKFVKGIRNAMLKNKHKTDENRCLRDIFWNGCGSGSWIETKDAFHEQRNDRANIGSFWEMGQV